MTEFNPIYLTEEEHTALDHAGVPGVPQSGATVAGLGDWARWQRAGAPDVGTGSFDFVVDLDDVNGATITVDNSSEWIDNWGVPSVNLAEEGAYFIALHQEGTAAAAHSLSLDFADPTGSPSDFGFSPTTFQGPLRVSSDTAAPLLLSATLFVPANTHLLVGFTAAGTLTSLTVQRVA